MLTSRRNFLAGLGTGGVGVALGLFGQEAWAVQESPITEQSLQVPDPHFDGDVSELPTQPIVRFEASAREIIVTGRIGLSDPACTGAQFEGVRYSAETDTLLVRIGSWSEAESWWPSAGGCTDIGRVEPYRATIRFADRLPMAVVAAVEASGESPAVSVERQNKQQFEDS
jgi:hypothetical protein